MALVVLGEKQAVFDAVVAPSAANSPRSRSFRNSFSLQPYRHCHSKRLESARGKCQVCLQQALELQQWLVVKGEQIDLLDRYTGLRKQYFAAFAGKRGSCFLLVNRSSCAAATMRPSSISAAALSW